MRRMHRDLTRFLAAPFILWFALSTSGPLPLSVCPMHETHGATQAGMAHSAHHMASHGGSPTVPQHQHGQQCTCPSECGATGSVGIAASSSITIAGNYGFVTPIEPLNAAEFALDRAAFLTPFANGPPTSLPI
jgi:hypothetical protein